MQPTLQRRAEITAIIRETAPTSQQEILVLLAERGFVITQPTLSRDLRELGVVKTPDSYLVPDDLEGASIARFVPRESRDERFEAAIRSLVISAVPSGTLVILRTQPAEAQPLARAIDEAGPDEVLGSIGGDDTVFVATPTVASAKALLDRIETISGSHVRRSRTRP